jgi:hypothetical protein
MRDTKLIVLILIFVLFSFTPYEYRAGEELFKENCSSCHAPTQTLTAPPFQKIRDDYGLDWTMQFINNPNKLIKEKDTKALYGLYRFGAHLPFRNLSRKDITEILDYIDSFPYDSSQYLYRKLSDTELVRFVDSIQFMQQKEWSKLNERAPSIDSVSRLHGTSGYGVDTKFRNTKKKPAKKKNGT